MSSLSSRLILWRAVAGVGGAGVASVCVVSQFIALQVQAVLCMFIAGSGDPLEEQKKLN